MFRVILGYLRVQDHLEDTRPSSKTKQKPKANQANNRNKKAGSHYAPMLARDSQAQGILLLQPPE